MILRTFFVAAYLSTTMALAGAPEPPESEVNGRIAQPGAVTVWMMRVLNCAKLDELQPHPAPREFLPLKLEPHVHYELWTAFGCGHQHTSVVTWGFTSDGGLFFAPLYDHDARVPPNYRWSGP